MSDDLCMSLTLLERTGFMHCNLNYEKYHLIDLNIIGIAQ